MRIAVTSQNFRTITPHAGVARRFLVYDIAPGEPPHEVDQWDLSRDMAVREFRGPGRHPLDAVDVVITGSAGSGFVRQMAARNVQAVVTSETDPITAVTHYVSGTLVLTDPDDQNSRPGLSSCLGVRLRMQRRRRQQTRQSGCRLLAIDEDRGF